MRHGVPLSSRCSRTGSPAFVGELCVASVSFTGAAIFVPVPYLLFAPWLTLPPSPDIRSHFSTQVMVTLASRRKAVPDDDTSGAGASAPLAHQYSEVEHPREEAAGKFPLSPGILDRAGRDRLGFRRNDPSRFVGFRGAVGGEHHF
jgi:hypothetical protein